MKEIIYKCDGCGKQKGEVNHWYSVAVVKVPAGLAITTIEESIKYSVNDNKGDWEHFCGEECLLKMVARNLPK